MWNNSLGFPEIIIPDGTDICGILCLKFYTKVGFLTWHETPMLKRVEIVKMWCGNEGASSNVKPFKEETLSYFLTSFFRPWHYTWRGIFEYLFMFTSHSASSLLDFIITEVNHCVQAQYPSNSSGGSRISRRGRRAPIGGVWTSDMGAFQWKCMQKWNNWVL